MGRTIRKGTRALRKSGHIQSLGVFQAKKAPENPRPGVFKAHRTGRQLEPSEDVGELGALAGRAQR